MKLGKLVCYLVILIAASTAFAQMYTVTDLCGQVCYAPTVTGINNLGQAVLTQMTGHYPYWALRTAPNSPVNLATDMVGPQGTKANDINISGQIVGMYPTSDPYVGWHAFRTAPNSNINPATDDLNVSAFSTSCLNEATGINDSGQVVGYARCWDNTWHAFRTASNSPINPATDDLGTLGGAVTWPTGINATGQVVGNAYTASGDTHAFRTAANSPINPATDDLGTGSVGTAINVSGQVVGFAYTASGTHAFRTAANSPINPATDDLGTLGGTWSQASGIDTFGQVVGWSLVADEITWHGFVYSGGVMHDLDDLIPAGCEVRYNASRDLNWIMIGPSMNDAGQVAGQVDCGDGLHPALLTPIYRAFVRPPINSDGSSVFSAKRGVVPVKFTLTQYDAPTCGLIPATIGITRTAGGTLRAIDESTYVANADSGTDFRIDPTACQYIYNLATSSLGVGTYRVDISMNGIMVGHAVFALK